MYLESKSKSEQKKYQPLEIRYSAHHSMRRSWMVTQNKNTSIDENLMINDQTCKQSLKQRQWESWCLPMQRRKSNLPSSYLSCTQATSPSPYFHPSSHVVFNGLTMRQEGKGTSRKQHDCENSWRSADRVIHETHLFFHFECIAQMLNSSIQVRGVGQKHRITPRSLRGLSAAVWLALSGFFCSTQQRGVVL